MTVLVGVRCVDGVVIGADSMATSAAGVFHLVQIPSNSKISVFGGNVIVAATGAVGLAQRFAHHVEAAIRGSVFKNLSRHECVTNLTRRLMEDVKSTSVSYHPQNGLCFGALVAGIIGGDHCLVEYGSIDFQPEVKEGRTFYVSMGSGQMLADPFLAFVSRVLWNDTMPTVDQARFGIYWALDHTIRLAPGGVGGPIKLAVLRKKADGNWKAEEIDELQENRFNRHRYLLAPSGSNAAGSRAEPSMLAMAARSAPHNEPINSPLHQSPES